MLHTVSVLDAVVNLDALDEGIDQSEGAAP